MSKDDFLKKWLIPTFQGIGIVLALVAGAGMLAMFFMTMIWGFIHAPFVSAAILVGGFGFWLGQAIAREKVP